MEHNDMSIAYFRQKDRGKLTKTEFYREITPSVKGLAAECLAMDAQGYEEFKCEIVEECDPRAKGFLRAVLSTIDRVREEKIK